MFVERRRPYRVTMGEPPAVPGDVLSLGRDLLRASFLLSLADGPRHGYDLADALRKQGGLAVSTSYADRTTREIDLAGLVSSQGEPSARAGPSRRVYQLTPAGDAALDLYA